MTQRHHHCHHDNFILVSMELAERKFFTNWVGTGNETTQSKASQSRVVRQQTQPTYCVGSWMAPGKHWWKESALNTEQPLSPLQQRNVNNRQNMYVNILILILLRVDVLQNQWYWNTFDILCHSLDCLTCKPRVTLKVIHFITFQDLRETILLWKSKVAHSTGMDPKWSWEPSCPSCSTTFEHWVDSFTAGASSCCLIWKSWKVESLASIITKAISFSRIKILQVLN